MSLLDICAVFDAYTDERDSCKTFARVKTVNVCMANTVWVLFPFNKCADLFIKESLTITQAQEIAKSKPKKQADLCD